jgi:hypothetical protein
MTAPAKLPPLKLLAKALELKGSGGLCFHRAAAFVFDVPGAVMVFGTLAGVDEAEAGPTDSTVPFIHAWAEWRGVVYAPTTIEATGGLLRPIDRALYYRVNGVTDVRTLTRAQLLRLDRQLALKRVLRAGGPCRGGASFGASLLDAAGVPWKAGPGDGVLPLADTDCSPPGRAAKGRRHA